MDPAGRLEFDRLNHAAFEVILTSRERCFADRAPDVVCPERFQSELPALLKFTPKGQRCPVGAHTRDSAIRDTQIRPNAAFAIPAGGVGNERRDSRRADTLYATLTALPLGRHAGLHLRRPVSWRGASAEFRQDAGQALNAAWTLSGICSMTEKARFLPDLQAPRLPCRPRPPFVSDHSKAEPVNDFETPTVSIY